MAHTLEKELQTYKDNLSEFKDKEGKFVLIHGEKVVAFYGTYEDAVKAGYEKFGLKPFLVRQIHAIEKVQVVTRLLDAPCHT